MQNGPRLSDFFHQSRLHFFASTPPVRHSTFKNPHNPSLNSRCFFFSFLFFMDLHYLQTGFSRCEIKITVSCSAALATFVRRFPEQKKPKTRRKNVSFFLSAHERMTNSLQQCVSSCQPKYSGYPGLKVSQFLRCDFFCSNQGEKTKVSRRL